MKKILQVVTVPLGYDGISAFARRIVAAMDRRDMQVDFLAINDVDAALREEISRMGCALHVIKGRMKNPAGYMLKLARLVRREGYTCVHVHGNSCTMAFDLLGAYLGGAEMRAAHSHNTFCNFMAAHRLLRPLFDNLYTHAFACGEEAGKWLFQNKPFRVIRNAVDAERFAYDENARAQCRAELGLGDETVIASVAHFSPQKNHVFAVEAFARYLKIDPSAKLVLVGEGAQRGEIEALIARLGIRDSVILTGLRTDIPRLLSAFDVMLLPSLYEGFPTVLLEWQAAGLPALASDTVTKDAAFTPLVKYLPISEGPEIWVDALMRAHVRADRAEESGMAIDAIQKAGYSLKSVAEELRGEYAAGGSAPCTPAKGT